VTRKVHHGVFVCVFRAPLRGGINFGTINIIGGAAASVAVILKMVRVQEMAQDTGGADG
jgi:hypothetical protein